MDIYIPHKPIVHTTGERIDADVELPDEDAIESINQYLCNIPIDDIGECREYALEVTSCIHEEMEIPDLISPYINQVADHLVIRKIESTDASVIITVGMRP